MSTIEQLIQRKYDVKKEGSKVDALSQGEVDVLEQVRDILGWPTITSLAVKYYPAYPNRKWWLEALRRVNKWARRKNIVYFLKALQSIAKEHLEAAFNGRGTLNRLVQHTNSMLSKGTNRLVPQAEGKYSMTDKYIALKYPGLVRVGGEPV